MKSDFNEQKRGFFDTILKHRMSKNNKKRIILLRKFREFTKNSEFTEEDAIRIGKEVNKRVSRRLKDETRN